MPGLFGKIGQARSVIIKCCACKSHSHCRQAGNASSCKYYEVSTQNDQVFHERTCNICLWIYFSMVIMGNNNCFSHQSSRVMVMESRLHSRYYTGNYFYCNDYLFRSLFSGYAKTSKTFAIFIFIRFLYRNEHFSYCYYCTCGFCPDFDGLGVCPAYFTSRASVI